MTKDFKPKGPRAGKNTMGDFVGKRRRDAEKRTAEVMAALTEEKRVRAEADRVLREKDGVR